MTKLTNAMRIKIRDRLIDKTAAPGLARLMRREHALAVRMLRARFGDDVFDVCRALPEGWLTTQKSLCLEYKWLQALPRRRKIIEQWGRKRDTLHPRGSIVLAEYTPLPNSAADAWTPDMVGPLIDDEVHALFEASVQLDENLDLLRQQITATLASFTTVEKLVDGWPAGYAELPAEMLAPPINGLPAPRIADLDARIAALREAA